jgi:hypothetical protein
MNLRFELVYILVILVVLSACVPSPMPTPVSTPTLVHTPTVVPSPTATAQPAATALPCPLDYHLHVDAGMGFSACYPTGWSISKRYNPDTGVTRMDFTAPADTNTRAGLRFASVSVSPAAPFSSDEEFVREINNWLLQEYYRRLLTYPDIIEVDGRKAVDAGYEAAVVLGREVVEVTRWVTAFWVEDRQWFIEVAGRSQYREELEEIHSKLLSHFHLLLP